MVIRYVILSLPAKIVQVVSNTSREVLEQFQTEFRDLSSRIGATTFGQAENVDMKKFEGLVYVGT